MGTILWFGGEILSGVAVRLRITGAVVSPTVTVKVIDAVFPEASVAVPVTEVTPIGNTLPDAGLKTIGKLPLTKSCADPLKLTTAPAGPDVSATRLPGPLRT